MSNSVDPAIIADLKERERTLAEREQKLWKDLQQAHDKDLEDQAIERENDEVMHALLNQVREELAEVRAALLRIAEQS